MALRLVCFSVLYLSTNCVALIATNFSVNPLFIFLFFFSQSHVNVYFQGYLPFVISFDLLYAEQCYSNDFTVCHREKKNVHD